MHYYKSKRPALLGDDKPDEPSTLVRVVTDPSVKLAAGAAATYHGYKRTGSILWALAYGVLGKMVPAVVIPVAVAQGFGKAKGGGS